MMDWLGSVSIMRNLRASFGLRRCAQVVQIVGVVLVVGFTLSVSIRGRSTETSLGLSEQCQIPAIYNFGDSNSDTGSVSATFGRVPYPNGVSFFGKPSGRYCDGRLIIDFIAERLGLPHLSAYLDSIGANFQHGADFAASGTTIEHVDGKMYGSGLNPLSLDIQLLQFADLKERTSELYEQDNALIKSRLPTPKDFSKALYTFDIGQNDIHNALVTTTEELARARTFWIHNTGPIGCLPYLLVKYPPKPGNVDEAGCIKSYNEVAEEFNRQLKIRISEMRTLFQDAFLVYVDIYTAKYNLISEAKKHGFVDPLGYCCKHPENSHLHCWSKETRNGTVVHAISCNNPSEYISWDSIHYTEAANKWIANRIVNGNLTDPPLAFTSLCRKPVFH